MNLENISIRPFNTDDYKQIIDLWFECNLVVPWNNPLLDIKRKEEVNPELFLVGIYEGELIATVMGGYEGHRGWINYLAVARKYRRLGIARLMMQIIEELLKEKGCPKINLQVRETNTEVVEFYESIGYKIEPIVNMGKILIPDPPYNVESNN